MFYKTKDYIRSWDDIVLPAFHDLHINDNVEQKTLLGGLFSLLIYSVVLYIALDQGERMLTYNDPEILSIEQPYHEYQDEVFLNQTAKPIFKIFQGHTTGSKNRPQDTVELDWESKKYVHVRIKKESKTYDSEDQMSTSTEYFKVTRCRKNIFKSQYE